MKPTFAKQKKIKKSTLRNKADKLISLWVRRNGYCEIKGLDKVRCGGVVQDMHIVGRANTALRYLISNHLCGCQGHHVYYTYHPTEWQQLIARYFPDRLQDIEDHKNDTVKKTEDLYREVIDKYKKLNKEAV